MNSPVVAIVTYGDRFGLCRATSLAALNQGVERVLIVAQSVSPASADALRALSRAERRIEVSFFADNPGSAVGFGRAMDAVACTTADYALFLDDDNELNSNGVNALMAQVAKYPSDRAEKIVLFAHRTNDKSQNLMLAGAAGAYPPAGSFLYFDAVTRMSRIVQRRRQVPASPLETASVPYGPYGGMLIPRSTLMAGARPDKSFVLYEDDTEFTQRLRAEGMDLILVGSATITDLDTKWSKESSASESGPVGLLEASDGNRRWFALRNRVAVDRANAADHRLRFAMNHLIFSAVISLMAVRRGRWRALREINSAISAGRSMVLERRAIETEFDRNK